jgi:hypothetical protein
LCDSLDHDHDAEEEVQALKETPLGRVRQKEVQEAEALTFREFAVM